MNKCQMSNAQMHKCSNAQRLKCTNAQMLKCASAQNIFFSDTTKTDLVDGTDADEVGLQVFSVHVLACVLEAFATNPSVCVCVCVVQDNKNHVK